MFINSWYAACRTQDLGDEPMQVRMLGCDFVLFRDTGGNIRCLSDTCCHRGASLAAGVCKGDTMMCPQHGWEFDGSGKCTLIPTGIKTPTHPPKRARVPSYPVEERYGLAYVFLGDMAEDERPQLPDIMPEYDTGEWHCGILKRHKDINYLRMHENYNDPCHVHYIHEFAKWLPKGVTIIDHEQTDKYVKAFHAAHDADGDWREDTGLMMEYAVIGSMSRNTNTHPTFPTQIVLASVTPIDEGNSQIFMHILQKNTGEESVKQHREMLEMTEQQVMDEDYAVLITTKPRQAAVPSEELLVETDVTLAYVRKITVEYGKQAGVIDAKALNEIRDTHIRVIPCPDHKSDPKGWVHKTVPLLDKPRGEANLKAAS